MDKRGENFISQIDESFYTAYSKSTWWIDSGATIHVANCLQGFHSTRTTQGRGITIRVANGVEVEVEGIGDLSLKLDSGFDLLLRDIFYIPSLQRNLISVNKLDDDDGFDYHFRNGRCVIRYNDMIFTTAFIFNDLYLL